MANKRIQDLTAAPSAPNASDIIEGERTPAGTPSSEKLTWTQIAAGAAFSAAYAPAASPVAVTETGTTSTLAQVDSAKTALYTNAALVSVTVPTGLTVGSFFVLVALGAGGLTISSTTGLTFTNGFTPKKTIARGESLYVEVTATNTIIVIGGTAA